MTDHAQWADSAAPYLLGALAPDEQRAYEAHLATCVECRDEVEDLRLAAEALPVSAPAVDPPAALQARIMAQVNREAELLAAAGPAADRPPEPERAPRRRRLPSLFRSALVMAALLVGVLAGVGISGALQDGAETLQVMVDPEQAPDASGELRRDDGEATLVVEDLPAPPAGRVYQVWVMPRGGNTPQPTDTLFLPREDGSAVAAVPDASDDVEAVLVTDEPQGGSAEPTRTPLLSVRTS